ncbi:MAG: hypothetical protein NC548_31825 [Lachnospiraceae bacterium]|nr:hypothetical protein [Lachnospiraceae bacterium]
MPGINFVMTADTSNITEKVGQVVSNIKDAQKIMEKTGATSGSFSDKITILNRAIRDSENLATKLANNINKYSESLKLAFNAGDTAKIDELNAKILDTAEALQNTTNRIDEYRSALKTTEGLASMGASTIPEVNSPQLYSSQEDYNKVTLLREQVAAIKSELAELGNKGLFDEAAAAQTEALRQSLSQTEGELRRMEVAASDAASKLGGELGGEAVETSTKLYELNNSIKQQEAVVDTLKRAVAVASIEFKNLKDSGADAMDIDEARVRYESLSNSLDNATNQLRNLQAAQIDAQTQWTQVNSKIQQHDSVFVKMIGGYDNYTKIVSNLPGPLQGVITGITGMTGAAKAFLGTPIGIALGAIVIVLQSLKTWFESSAEGQMAFAKISGYVTGVLNQLKEVVINVGKKFYELGKGIVKAFQEPKAAINSLWESIKNNLVKRAEGLAGIFSNLGKIIDSAFSRDWDGVKNNFKNLTNSVVQSMSGIENATEKIGKASDKAKDAITNLNNAAKENAAIKVEEKQLEIAEHQWAKEKAKLDKQKAEARAKLFNTSLSPSERAKAMADYEAILDKQYAKEEEFADKKIELQQRTMALTTNTIEDNNRLEDLLAARAQLDARKAQELASLQRRKNGIVNAENTALNKENTRLEYEKKINNDLLQLRIKNQASEIALMEDAREKRLAQIDNDFESEKAAIMKKATELAKANKKAKTQGTGADGLTDEQRLEIENSLSLNERAHEKAMADIAKEDAQSMRTYLQEYGTFQQQKLAIAEEYAEKIRKANNTGEKLSLEQERESKIASVNAAELAGGIDWSVAFSGVGNVLGDIARETLKKVEDYMKTSDFKKLNASDKKAYTDLRENLQKEIGGNSTSPFNFGIWGKVAKDVEAYQQAVQRTRAANDMHTDAINRYKQAVEDAKNAITDEEKARADLSVRLARTNVNITAEGVKSAEAVQSEAQSELSDSSQAATNGLNSFAATLSEISNGSLYGFTNGITKLVTSLMGGSNGVGKALGELGGKIGGLIGAILTILDAMGDDPTKFITGVLDSVFDAVGNIISQLRVDKAFSRNGLLGGIANSLVDGIGGILDTFSFGVFGTRISDPHLADRLEALSNTNDRLQTAIERLTEAMEGASIADIFENFEKQMENLSKIEENTQEKLIGATFIYKKSNIFGNGGHDSARKLINQGLSIDDWQRISKAVGRDIYKAEDFFYMSADEMYKVYKDASDLYGKIQDIAAKGYWNNGGELMDEYIDIIRQREELERAMKESITGISFDSVKSDFSSMLSDMSSEAKDFSENFEEMLRSAVVNTWMANEFGKRLEDWYDHLAELQEGGLTRDKIELLRKEWDEISADAEQKKKEFEELGILTSSSSTTSQQASGGYQTSLSEDTGTEIKGLLTATHFELVKSNESNSVIADAILSNVTSLTQLNTSASTAVQLLDGILLQNTYANNHLTDLVKFSKQIIAFGDNIERIAKNTDKL